MKKAFGIMVFVILLSILSGCWSRQEPTMIAIMESVIYDIRDDGTYHTIVELFYPKQDKQNKKKNIVAEASGKSPFDTLRNMTVTIDRKIYGPHTKVRFFSEKLASMGIGSMLDFFVRDPNTRQNAYIVIIRGDRPELLYECGSEFQDSIGDFIESLVDAQHRSASFSAYVTMLDFIKAYYEDGKQPVAGVVEIVADKDNPSMENSKDKELSESGGENQRASNNYKIEYSGLAAFKEDKLVGFLNREETQAYNILVNKFQNYYFSTCVAASNYNIVLEAITVKTEIKTAIQNDQAEISVLVHIETALASNSDKFDMENPEDKNKVTDSFNQQIENQINSAIKKVQNEFKSDIFGFGKQVHIQHPKDWDKIRGDWDDFFSKANVNVKVESSIRRTGELQNPIKKES